MSPHVELEKLTDEDLTAASRGPSKSTTPVKSVNVEQSTQKHLTPTKVVDLSIEPVAKDNTDVIVSNENKAGDIVSPKDNTDFMVSPKDTGGDVIPVKITTEGVVAPKDQMSLGILPVSASDVVPPNVVPSDIATPKDQTDSVAPSGSSCDIITPKDQMSLVVPPEKTVIDVDENDDGSETPCQSEGTGEVHFADDRIKVKAGLFTLTPPCKVRSYQSTDLSEHFDNPIERSTTKIVLSPNIEQVSSAIDDVDPNMDHNDLSAPVEQNANTVIMVKDSDVTEIKPAVVGNQGPSSDTFVIDPYISPDELKQRVNEQLAIMRQEGGWFY